MTAKLAIHVSEEKQWKVNWKLMELFLPDSPPFYILPCDKSTVEGRDEATIKEF
jgi:hypothetical protein